MEHRVSHSQSPHDNVAGRRLNFPHYRCASAVSHGCSHNYRQWLHPRVIRHFSIVPSSVLKWFNRFESVVLLSLVTLVRSGSCHLSRFERRPCSPNIYLYRKEQDSATVQLWPCNCRRADWRDKTSLLTNKYWSGLAATTFHFHAKFLAIFCKADLLAVLFKCYFQNSKHQDKHILDFLLCFPPPTKPAVILFFAPNYPQSFSFFAYTLLCQQGWFSVCAVVSLRTADWTSALVWKQFLDDSSSGNSRLATLRASAEHLPPAWPVVSGFSPQRSQDSYTKSSSRFISASCSGLNTPPAHLWTP